MIWVLIAIALVVFYIYFYRKFAVLPDNSIMMLNGGLGSGKTSLAVGASIRDYKSRLRSWKICKVLFPWKKREKPVLCSSIPLKCEYVPLTLEILERKVRLPYGSVVLIDEFSLVADSMSYKTINNTVLMLFIKLFRQETRGGVMYITTQSLSDTFYMVGCVVVQFNIYRRVLILNKGLFSSVKQDWQTPYDFILSLEVMPTLDCCCSYNNLNLVRCITNRDDFFLVYKKIANEVIWCNPSYNNQRAFIEKLLEIRNQNKLIYVLIPARTDTKLFHELLYKKPGIEIEFIKGRLKFVGGFGSAPFPSMLIKIYPRKDLDF